LLSLTFSDNFLAFSKNFDFSRIFFGGLAGIGRRNLIISACLSLGLWLFKIGLTLLFIGVNLNATSCLKVVFLLLVYTLVLKME